MAVVAACPKCRKPIDETHPYPWCIKCGEPFPEEIRTKLPRVTAVTDAASAATGAQRAEVFSSPSAPGADSRTSFGTLGFIIGALVGFLTRPSAMLIGQLPFLTVISRGSTLGGMDQLFVPTAEASFNQMLILAILGAGVGVGIGYARMKAKEGAATALLSSPQSVPTVTPLSPDAETLNNDAVIKMVDAGLGEDVVLEKMKCSRCAFDLSSSVLADLKQKGVSDRLIAAMLQKQSRV